MVSRPALYDQLLSCGTYVEAITQAANAISKAGDDDRTANSLSLPEDESAAISVDDILPDWSILPPSSSFDGVLPDDDVSLLLSLLLFHLADRFFLANVS